MADEGELRHDAQAEGPVLLATLQSLVDQAAAAGTQVCVVEGTVALLPADHEALAEEQRSAAAISPIEWTQEQAKSLFDDAATCDKLLQVCGRVFHVHGALLASRSSFFAALLGGGFAEQQQAVIALDVPAPSPAAVETVLLHLYTGALELPTGGDALLLQVAHNAAYLDAPDLFRACIDALAAGAWRAIASANPSAFAANVSPTEVRSAAFADTLESAAVTQWLSGSSGAAAKTAAEHLPVAVAHAASERERLRLKQRVNELESRVLSHESTRKCRQCGLIISDSDRLSHTGNACSDCIGWSAKKNCKACGLRRFNGHCFHF
ncbi:hypothetical protein JKP88DRAFT_254705 [Tribonema minus]|uniref:BTB domain-containing protein n=1 Tax=Tribonema minus TaxID=303371 RepID=A0A836CHM8_9STRA|nr:hypothetical protein JKP88DRAFT_254705 [Tribonema minus]